jgi:carboxymethylenebutenolidase
MKVTTDWIQLEMDQKMMMVYRAQPRGIKSDQTIIVYMEAFGVNGHIQDICHRLAHEGYEVLAPDLYYRWGRNLQFEYSDRASAISFLKKMTEGQLIQDITALMNFIRQELQTPHIATLGFCVGGYISVLSAIHFPLVTAVSFYGAGLVHGREGFKLKPLVQNFNLIRSPLLLFFGDRDASIPATEIEVIASTLKGYKKKFQIKVFRDANHGFFCGQRGSYQAEAAHVSWEMTLEWLANSYSIAERSRSVSSSEGFSPDASPML